MTQNERSKTVKANETQVLLQILSIGETQVSAGQVYPLADVIKSISERPSMLKVAARGNRKKPKKQKH
jgi:hypothetical protein